MPVLPAGYGAPWRELAGMKHCPGTSTISVATRIGVVYHPRRRAE